MLAVAMGCTADQAVDPGELAWRLCPEVGADGTETTTWHDIEGRERLRVMSHPDYEAVITHTYGEWGLDTRLGTLDGEVEDKQVWFYDDQGRPTRIEKTYQDVAGVTQHTYEGDLLVRTEESTDDWRLVWVYDYDDAGRLVTSSSGEPLTAQSIRTYDAPAPSLDHTEVTLGGELSIDRRYDDRDRLVSLVSRYGGVVGSEQWFAWSDDVVVRDEYHFPVDDRTVQRVTTYFDDGRIDRRVDTDEDSGEVLSEYVAEWTRL